MRPHDGRRITVKTPKVRTSRARPPGGRRPTPIPVTPLDDIDQMSPRPLSPRPFAGFWERKLRQILTRAGAFRYEMRTLEEATADRRRFNAWAHGMYAAPFSATDLQPADVLELVAVTIDESKRAGHRTDRMFVQIPIAVHRLWCSDLIALPDPTGWPTLDGVPIRTDEWSTPPPGWSAGMPVIDPTGDRVEVWARQRDEPVLERYILGKGHAAIEPIYSRLRLDGWTIADAREAATLLHQARQP